MAHVVYVKCFMQQVMALWCCLQIPIWDDIGEPNIILIYWEYIKHTRFVVISLNVFVYVYVCMSFTCIFYSNMVSQLKYPLFFKQLNGLRLVFEIEIWDPRRTIEDAQVFINATQTSYEMV